MPMPSQQTYVARTSSIAPPMTSNLYNTQHRTFYFWRKHRRTFPKDGQMYPCPHDGQTPHSQKTPQLLYPFGTTSWKGKSVTFTNLLGPLLCSCFSMSLYFLYVYIFLAPPQGVAPVTLYYRPMCLL